ncbi:MAG TPA: tripartite tricarboxylate transporter TctB family protein [Candidatus Avidesulfovibrio excrementigallinarum]|nr:tripartite tricarboxylate transporter TctB family protein [Candidatus Avidesulfovibrio excrementigallinarum]
MNSHKTYLGEFIVTFGIGLIAFLQTFSFDDPIELYRYGANCWPAAIAVSMMVCSLCLYGYRRIAPPSKEDAAEDPDDLPFRKRVPVFVIPIIFVLLLPYIGFYAGVLIFLPVYSWFLGQRRILKTLSVCIPVAALIIFIFTKYLFVPFPVGTWAGFYEFNSALVAFLY